MKSRRKIIVYIATSADGYIARPDGDVEWLNRAARLDYGMRAFYRTIDTILWGRKTYDWALEYQKKKRMKESMFDKNVANYVFSRKPPKKVAPGVEFVSKPLKAFVRRLRATPGKHIWMMGGRRTDRLVSRRRRDRRIRDSCGSHLHRRRHTAGCATPP